MTAGGVTAGGGWCDCWGEGGVTGYCDNTLCRLQPSSGSRDNLNFARHTAGPLQRQLHLCTSANTRSRHDAGARPDARAMARLGSGPRSWPRTRDLGSADSQLALTQPDVARRSQTRLDAARRSPTQPDAARPRQVQTATVGADLCTRCSSPSAARRCMACRLTCPSTRSLLPPAE